VAAESTRPRSNVAYPRAHDRLHATCSFTYDVLGASAFAWTRNGEPLSDALTPTGAVISGSSTRTLTISDALPGDTGLE
jgi:hypothetical protein